MFVRAVPPIRITDESAYVKVTHGDGVIIYFVKASLIVQKVNANTFMLKNDSFVKYYTYSDVIVPTTLDIDALVELIASWNTALSNLFGTISTSSMYMYRPTTSNTSNI